MSRWHVIEGRGEAILAKIGHDVQTYQRNKASAEKITGAILAKSGTIDIAGAKYNQLRIGQVYVREAARDGYLGDIPRIVGELDKETIRDILLAHIGILSLSHIQSLENGREFDLFKRARVEVIAEGVSREPSFRADGWPELAKLAGTAAIGDVYTGRILDFTSRPPVGGFIAFDRLVSTSLQGLVDPQTGEPRVHLDILAKR